MNFITLDRVLNLSIENFDISASQDFKSSSEKFYSKYKYIKKGEEKASAFVYPLDN